MLPGALCIIACMLIHERAVDIIISDRYNVYSLHKKSQSIMGLKSEYIPVPRLVFIQLSM